MKLPSERPLTTSNAGPAKVLLSPVPHRGALYQKIGKRFLDVIVSGFLIALLLPLCLVIGLLVKLTSKGPVFYRQERIGKNGRVFNIVKFRSMIQNADSQGPQVTSAGDHRITKVGAWLRRLKFDELPQLWNVLNGEMSLVGPRPEVPGYVAAYDLEYRAVLRVRPGITDNASIAYRWEEDLLCQAPDPERYYREVILPCKLALNLEYIQNISLTRDAALILRTAYYLFIPRSGRS